MGRKNIAVAEYLVTASILQRSGDPTKAAQAVEHALKVNPESPEARRAQEMLKKNQLLPEPEKLGGITAPVRMAEVRQLEAAEVPEEKALDPIPESRQKALVQLASLLFEQPDEMGLRNTQTLSQGGRKSIDYAKVSMHQGQAIDAQTRRHETEAAKELERVLDVGMTHPAVFFVLGMLLTSHEGKKALRYLQEVEKHPDYSLASYLLVG